MQIIEGIPALRALIGQELGIGSWHDVPQSTIEAFADATGDHQWLHVDAERAAAGPYGTTIAHGYLVLSLLPALAADAYSIEGASARINYGLERVRFPSAVPSGARIRVHSTLTELEETPTGARIVVRNVVELEGSDKPACIADTVSLLVFPAADTNTGDTSTERN
jgi:acyl dehydratase